MKATKNKELSTKVYYAFCTETILLLLFELIEWQLSFQIDYSFSLEKNFKVKWLYSGSMIFCLMQVCLIKFA